MFWSKTSKKPSEQKEDNYQPYLKRSCWIYISDTFKQVLFVPMGRITPFSSRELDDVIVSEWPLNIGVFQEHIQSTLDKFQQSVEDIENSNDSWFSFKSSKAKTQQSFRVEYVQIQLETDDERKYGEMEKERIIVRGSPFDWNKDNYKVIGKSHLVDTGVAQVVFDIYRACEKIRT